jgi:hypothetical protein
MEQMIYHKNLDREKSDISTKIQREYKCINTFNPQPNVTERRVLRVQRINNLHVKCEQENEDKIKEIKEAFREASNSRIEFEYTQNNNLALKYKLPACTMTEEQVVNSIMALNVILTDNQDNYHMTNRFNATTYNQKLLDKMTKCYNVTNGKRITRRTRRKCAQRQIKKREYRLSKQNEQMYVQTFHILRCRINE